jgi:hypothetical protein
VSADSASIRRFAGWALVGGLSVAAVAAVVALIAGSFDDTSGRVILTSIGFALSSATGSAGANARLRSSERLQQLGTATVLASGTAFVLLVIGTWTSDWGSEGIWRAFGCVAVLGLTGAHACVLSGAIRPGDSDAVRRITLIAVGLGAVDAFSVVLPLSSLVDDVDEVAARIFGASLVLLVLTSVLPPILRRMQPVRSASPLASQVTEIADRIDALNADPGNRAPEIRAETIRLRKLAESLET